MAGKGLQRSFCLADSGEYRPALDTLQGDPMYRDLLRRMGLGKTSPPGLALPNE